MPYSSNVQKLSLIFCLKNCEKNIYYKILAILEDAQSGYKKVFNTKEKQCLKDDSEIIFNKKMSSNTISKESKNLKLNCKSKKSFNKFK